MASFEIVHVSIKEVALPTREDTAAGILVGSLKPRYMIASGTPPGPSIQKRWRDSLA